MVFFLAVELEKTYLRILSCRLAISGNSTLKASILHQLAQSGLGTDGGFSLSPSACQKQI